MRVSVMELGRFTAGTGWQQAREKAGRNFIILHPAGGINEAKASSGAAGKSVNHEGHEGSQRETRKHDSALFAVPYVALRRKLSTAKCAQGTAKDAKEFLALRFV